MSHHDCPHCGLPSTKTPRRTPMQSPYETHLGKNMAFTVQDHVRVDIVNLVAGARADIADLDRDIEKIETSLAAAKKERDVLVAYRDVHLTLFPPVHQLPTEVLTEIFHLTFEKPYDAFASSRRGPWLLGKVCSRWRQVAWSCASLWTDFTLGDPRGRASFHKAGTKNLFEGALLRTAKRNKFHVPLGGLKKPEVNFIVKNAAHWHDASFEGFLKEFEPFLKIGKMPSLAALALICKYPENLDTYYQLVSSLGRHAPRLRKLALATIMFSPRTDTALWKIDLPWSQLTELIVPLDYIVSCQHLLACCSHLKTLKDNPHVSPYDRLKEASNIPGLQAIVSHAKVSFIDMSPSLAITLLDHIGCPGLTKLSLPCPREGQSDGEILQRFIQRSGCTITNAELTFDHYEKPLVSPEPFLSALSGIIDLKLSFRKHCPEGRLIECLWDRTVAPQLLTLTIAATKISRSTWDGGLKDTLIRVLSARYEASSTGTNLREVDIVLGREAFMTPGGRVYGSAYYREGCYYLQDNNAPPHLRDDFGKNWTIKNPVDADFVEFRKLRESGLDIRLSMWKGRTLIRYV